MVHFAPCTKEISAEKYAQLFIHHVFKHHGLPEVIISDRDPRFTSRFWRELFQKLGTDLRFSTAFHPQTDGQSEVTIRVLENFLRPYVERSPHAWVQQLPLAEFAANNAVSICCGAFRHPAGSFSAHQNGHGDTNTGDQNSPRMKRLQTAHHNHIYNTYKFVH